MLAKRPAHQLPCRSVGITLPTLLSRPAGQAQLIPFLIVNKIQGDQIRAQLQIDRSGLDTRQQQLCTGLGTLNSQREFIGLRAYVQLVTTGPAVEIFIEQIALARYPVFQKYCPFAQ